MKDRRPVRHQRRRSAGSRLPAGTVCVTRPSRWGNPFHVEGFAPRVAHLPVRQRDEAARELAASAFARALLTGGLEFDVADVQRELRGRDLACYCSAAAPGGPERCHADVLLRVANEPGMAHASSAAMPKKKAAKKTRKYGKKASAKVGKALRERKQGKLRSGGSKKKVKSKKQAVAIALSQARAEGGKVPAKRSSGAKKKKRSKKAASTKSGRKTSRGG